MYRRVSRLLPADAFWNLCLAVNVYLIVFRKHDSKQLKSMEWKYHILCYGCPFLVAFICLFIDRGYRGCIYGPFVLWCWIDIRYMGLGIGLSYAQVWITILMLFCIYIMAGLEILIERSQLRDFHHDRAQVRHVERSITDYITTKAQKTCRCENMRRRSHQMKMQSWRPHLKDSQTRTPHQLQIDCESARDLI